MNSFKCIDCNNTVVNKKAKRCLTCSRKRQFQISENNPNWKGGLPKCLDCFIVISKGKLRCRNCCFKGFNNPNYQNGLFINRSKYPKIFKTIRNKIRERDNFICQLCGLQEKIHLYRFNANLTVHHIDYNKENCKKSNLITLCFSCNSKANFNRDYWFAYYSYIMENKI